MFTATGAFAASGGAASADPAINNIAETIDDQTNAFR
jgi:hypothetical protein